MSSAKRITVPLGEIGVLDSGALRKYCDHTSVSVLQIPMPRLAWTGLVFCTPLDAIWAALPLWMEAGTSGKIFDWTWREIAKDDTYKTFLQELRESGVPKDRLSRNLFSYQMASAYGSRNAPPFGKKGAGLFDGWFRACTIPSRSVDSVLNYFRDYWAEVGAEAMVRCDDLGIESADYFFNSPPSSDYSDAKLLTWGHGTPQFSRQIRDEYFGNVISKLEMLVSNPNSEAMRLNLHPVHAAKPPLAFLSWPSFAKEDRSAVDQINSLKARLVNRLGWARFSGVVSALVGDQNSYPSAYEAESSVRYDIAEELAGYLERLRVRVPLLFQEPDIE